MKKDKMCLKFKIYEDSFLSAKTVTFTEEGEVNCSGNISEKTLNGKNNFPKNKTIDKISG